MKIPYPDGGPAFPATQMQAHGGPTQWLGMSLRDFFACAALASHDSAASPHLTAKRAYAIADAMLAMRAAAEE